MILESIFNQAHAEGNAAVVATTVTPMIVTQAANPLDDSSAVVNAWIVDDGVCGFASVIVKPANCRFAKYLLDIGIGRKGYGGGVTMSVRDFNQSLTKKEAYAEGFAKVLRDNGINAWVDSRMD
jgi:hypothetical protein